MATTELQANGMTFSCRTGGAPDGEPVLLLHGFPETSIMWVPLMATLAGEGYRCVAPDQRGYSQGARPDGVAAYDYASLCSDVFAIADAAGFAQFHLIGHDWGAIVGYVTVCSAQRGRVLSFTSMSVPYPPAFAQAVKDDPEEEPYRGILQALMTPGVFEAVAVANEGAGLRAAYTNQDAAEIDEYVRVLGEPGAMAAAANWYRASDAHNAALADDAPFGPVETPTLLIWGSKDLYVRRMSVDLAAPAHNGPYRVAEVDAGHWLVQEAPQAVTVEVQAHLHQYKR